MAFDPDLSLGATAQLHWEHRVIEAVVACARRLPPLASADEAARDDLAFVVAFFDRYMHGWHFQNEETYFVPVLHHMGTDDAQRAAVHIDVEHQQSHVALKALRAHLAAALQGDAEAMASFDGALPPYLDLALTHIHLEDRYLYLLLQRVLSSIAQRHLGWVLRHDPATEGRPGLPQDLEDQARALAARHGVAFPTWDAVLAGLQEAAGEPQ
jgi:hemerythrin-like domain-containing protein